MLKKLLKQIFEFLWPVIIEELKKLIDKWFEDEKVTKTEIKNFLSSDDIFEAVSKKIKNIP